MCVSIRQNSFDISCADSGPQKPSELNSVVNSANLSKHVHNVLLMSASLEHINQSSHKPAAELRVTPRFIACSHAAALHFNQAVTHTQLPYDNARYIRQNISADAAINTLKATCRIEKSVMKQYIQQHARHIMFFTGGCTMTCQPPVTIISHSYRSW